MPDSRASTRTSTARPAGKHARSRRARVVPVVARPAPRHARRRPATRFASAAPRIVGLAALSVAAAGSLGAATPSDTPVAGVRTAIRSVALPALGSVDAVGTDGVDALAGRVVLDREVRPSRASSRQALADAAGGRVERPRSAQARERNAGLAELAASAEAAAAELAEDAWQLPLPVGTYRLSARFGECSSLWSHCHTGLDLSAPSGTPVLAVAGGVVEETGYAGSYGNRVVLTLDDGTEVWFCHLTDFGVTKGQRVLGGQQVGTVGSTGNSTGPHLHLEIRPGGGDPVDPYGTLAARGLTP